MGIFQGLFKKKQKSKPSTSERTIPPAELFKQIGHTMFSLWESFVEGQNQAAKEFDGFKSFKRSLDLKFNTIDFDRSVFDISTEKGVEHIKVKHAMYLYMLDIENSTYIAFEDPDNAVVLSEDDYEIITSRLSYEEISYCEKLFSYIKNNIYSLVTKTDTTRFGIEMCKYPIPFNTRELTDYHRFIASGDYNRMSDQYTKWHHISNAPFLSSRKTTKDNPLILTEMSAISAFVLDYLCYATISLPTLDMTRVLLYRNDKGISLRDMIIDRFGISTMEYITQVIDDLNGVMFRESVYTGLLIK